MSPPSRLGTCCGAAGAAAIVAASRFARAVLSLSERAPPEDSVQDSPPAAPSETSAAGASSAGASSAGASSAGASSEGASAAALAGDDGDRGVVRVAHEQPEDVGALGSSDVDDRGVAEGHGGLQL